MNDTITTTELIALVIRGGKKILCAALVCAVLLGGLQTVLQISAADDEVRSKDVEEYYQEVRQLEKTIEREQHGLENRREYIANSLYMKLDPYDVYTTTISLAITDLEESAFQQVFRDEETPVEYLTGKIVSYYLTLWNSFDLPSELGLPEYENVLDKYMRELVYISTSGGGILTIQALGANASESEALANAAYALLKAQQDTVSAGAYHHAFSLLDNVTKSTIDFGMEAAQQAQYDGIDIGQDAIVNAKVEIQELAGPDSMGTAITKFVIIGAVVGAVLAGLWLCLRGIVCGQVLSSRQMERSFHVPFLGSVAENKGLFVRKANAVSGERVWDNREQSLEYISEKAKAQCAGKKILLTTTLPLAADDSLVKMLAAAVGKDAVRFEGDFSHNPGAVKALADCEEVLLLESVGRSDMSAISEVMNAAQRCGCSVGGFVLI